MLNLVGYIRVRNKDHGAAVVLTVAIIRNEQLVRIALLGDNLDSGPARCE